MSLLETVTTPSDVKKMTIAQLEELAEDLRKKIIDTVTVNGGHLSSNLGMVDMIVALYHVFDFPQDKLIFDVGHQSYAHKLLSGRLDKFDTIRREGGLSGFPFIEESVYDAFGAGHAGSSVSAALGCCSARDAFGQDYRVIDVVGDASLFNGENLEALTCKDTKPNGLIIILNDNGMSISKNDNGMYKLFSKMRTRKAYGRFMSFANKTIGSSFIGKRLKRLKKSIKISINNATAVEALGFKYVGVFDGNDMKELVKILENLKYSDKAVVLHLRTKKGKGMIEAETDSESYHGVGKNLNVSKNTFSSAMGDALCAAAEKRRDLTAVCAGMKDGTGLKRFAELYPDRFFDVGIAEEHAVTFAAGQAAGGLTPIVCIYSTFLQRAYDQIMQDVCLQKLPVIFMVDRAGAVGSDGATHQGLFDISYLSAMPNMSVFAPKDTIELERVFNYALSLKAPCAIRYPNGINDLFADHTPVTARNLWEYKGEIEKNVLIAVGPRALRACYAAAEGKNEVTVVNARVVKPLDKLFLDKLVGKNVITVEEGVLSGGFGSAVNSYLTGNGMNCRLKNIGFADEFVMHASVDVQLKKAGVTPDNIAQFMV